MKTLALLAPLLLLQPPVSAGALPSTAKCIFEGKEPLPARVVEMDPAWIATAVLPDGVEEPAASILGPIRRLAPGPGGTVELPPSWTWFVGPRDRRLGDAGAAALAGAVGERGIPGLDLSYCRGVTDAGLETLEGAGNILYLSLANTSVTDDGLARVAKMPGLVALDLSGLSGVTDTGVSKLAALSRLAALDLSGLMQVGDDGIEAILGAGKLVWLDLGATRATDAALKALGRAKAARGLRVLELRECMGITDAGLATLAALRDLEELGLASLPITDEGMEAVGKLRSLTALDLSMTRVTDEGVEKLAGLRKLAWLSLEEAPVTDDGLGVLRRFRDLRILRLDGSGVTPAGLRALRGRTGLEELSISRATVTDEAMATVATLTGLRTLSLRFPDALTDEGLGKLSGLKGLRRLALTAAAGITDEGLSTLADLEVLEWLDLSRCAGLTGAAVDELRNALPDCRIIGPNDFALGPNTPADVRRR